MAKRVRPIPFEDLTIELVYPKSKAKKIQRSSRTETYEELRADMLEVYDLLTWTIMADYVHGDEKMIHPTRELQSFKNFKDF